LPSEREAARNFTHRDIVGVPRLELGTRDAWGQGMSTTKTTTDHEIIRQWTESRGGFPAHVIGTGDPEEGDAGLLRIDFPGYSGEGRLERVDWDTFFEKFDEKELAFIYQEETASGEPSFFNKLVSRESASGSSS
jgi:hypothetical protein